MAGSPDGNKLHVASCDKLKRYVAHSASGEIVKMLDVPGRSHNMIYAGDETRAHLTPVSSPIR